MRVDSFGNNPGDIDFAAADIFNDAGERRDRGHYLKAL
jgi:hypothetical protein